MDDLTYLQANFLDQKQLCEMACISPEKLEELIEKELIPKPSYTIESRWTITSPLGDKAELSEITKYFPKSTTSLIQQNINRDSAAFKAEMKSRYIQTVLDNDMNKRTYQTEAELDEVFETQWKHYINGVYGICTLSSTAEEIAKKDIAVSELIHFMENQQGFTTTEKQEKLKVLNDNYNEISSIFAPYQRKKSSRGKYVDTQLRENDLVHLIKSYNY